MVIFIFKGEGGRGYLCFFSDFPYFKKEASNLFLHNGVLPLFDEK